MLLRRLACMLLIVLVVVAVPVALHLQPAPQEPTLRADGSKPPPPPPPPIDPYTAGIAA